MKIITPRVDLVGEFDGVKLLKNIELAGRVCYKSEEKISYNSYKKFINEILSRGHESVIEHEKVTVKVICDRGVSHELVRHRIASYSQESTRYCNYSANKYGSEITIIKPCFWEENSAEYAIWQATMEMIEAAYLKLLETGATAQQARSVLPNSLKTEIFVTMNMREWRHFFKLRLAKNAHPQMREIANMILQILKSEIEIIFDDFTVETGYGI
jgi:thymidylate synthase (FAD)